jgi:hypothetical protein
VFGDPARLFAGRLRGRQRDDEWIRRRGDEQLDQLEQQQQQHEQLEQQQLEHEQLGELVVHHRA